MYDTIWDEGYFSQDYEGRWKNTSRLLVMMHRWILVMRKMDEMVYAERSTTYRYCVLDKKSKTFIEPDEWLTDQPGNEIPSENQCWMLIVSTQWTMVQNQ